MWEKLAGHRNKIIIILAALVVLDFLVFLQIGRAGTEKNDLKIYFLSVGQGDSELVELPGGVRILIDGGPPNGRVLEELAKVMPVGNRYIDLVMMSHPQLDHFGGLVEVLKRYKVGAFLTNGREGEISAFADLKRVLDGNSIKTVSLSAGDVIRHGESRFDVLSPSLALIASKELNDTSIVAELSSKDSKILFTGDINADVEEKIAASVGNLDILKVAHHGSKFSSSANFLAAISPAVAVIEVGKNSYGHPTKEALERIGGAGARIFRTDLDGTVKFLIGDGNIRIFKSGGVK
ncbi:MAG TPA: MBL fold metallo-hydrolase [Candidatus Paceibacterota bacterium]|nr:MBL fold metallo-hydrolase [Candidatus Paceibacterota bacterium]